MRCKARNKSSTKNDLLMQTSSAMLAHANRGESASNRDEARTRNPPRNPKGTEKRDPREDTVHQPGCRRSWASWWSSPACTPSSTTWVGEEAARLPREARLRRRSRRGSRFQVRFTCAAWPHGAQISSAAGTLGARNFIPFYLPVVHVVASASCPQSAPPSFAPGT
jgi:hypothetical protein